MKKSIFYLKNLFKFNFKVKKILNELNSKFKINRWNLKLKLMLKHNIFF
jgi:hypothetical protein